MARLKLMTVVGTRPEIIRLSETIRCCDRHFDQYLVHTGQNWDYELNQIFFDDLRLRQPDEYLGVVGENLGQTLGNVIAQSYECLLRVKPDALLVLGDTNSCLAAIAAKRLHIPLFHMEAGNRCFDERLPEETNRRIVDHISDVNICYSEHARRNLLAEGLPQARTFVCGSPMPEVLAAHIERIEASDVLGRLGLESGRYLLLSAHREENVDDERSFFTLMSAVNELAETYGMPILYSVHPRSAAWIERRGFVFHPLVRTHAPLSFTDYNHLQMHAACVVSDSGTLPEEAAWYAAHGHLVPAVCVRTSTERPEAFETGTFVLGSVAGEQVVQAVALAMEQAAAGELPTPVADYTSENVSSKVVRIIQSYTPIVNDVVWRKQRA